MFDFVIKPFMAAAKFNWREVYEDIGWLDESIHHNGSNEWDSSAINVMRVLEENDSVVSASTPWAVPRPLSCFLGVLRRGRSARTRDGNTPWFGQNFGGGVYFVLSILKSSFILSKIFARFAPVFIPRESQNFRVRVLFYSVSIWKSLPGFC